MSCSYLEADTLAESQYFYPSKSRPMWKTSIYWALFYQKFYHVQNLVDSFRSWHMALCGLCDKRQLKSHTTCNLGLKNTRDDLVWNWNAKPFYQFSYWLISVEHCYVLGEQSHRALPCRGSHMAKGESSCGVDELFLWFPIRAFNFLQQLPGIYNTERRMKQSIKLFWFSFDILNSKVIPQIENSRPKGKTYI